MRRLLVTAIFIVAFVGVQCHETLLDFVNFQVNFPNVTLSEDCADDLNLFKNALENRDMWALKVLDLSGKPAPGFITGNNFWLGRELACNMMNNPRKIPMTFSPTRKFDTALVEVASEITVQYRIFYVNHTSSLQYDSEMFKFRGLTIGLCFPKNCNKDVNDMSRLIFSSDSWQHNPMLGNVSFVRTKNLELRDNFFSEPFVIMLISTLLVCGFLISFGAFYVWRVDKNREKDQLEGFLEKINNNNNNKLEPVPKHKMSSVEKFWRGFALQENLKSIFSTSLPDDALPGINGLRAIATAWIISGHIYYYALSSIENIQLLFSYADLLALQPYVATLLAVDIFFAVAGFLLAFRFFEQQKKGRKTNLLTFTIKKIILRYFRLVPCFLVIMLIAGVVGIFLNDTSAFLMFEEIEDNCKAYWWRNVLMIQNFYPLDELCMTWSWYVAADFHLFTITSILLALSVKHKKLSTVLGGLFVIATSIYCGYLGVKHSYNLTVDGQYRTGDYLYLGTHTRVGPYFAGVIMGYYLSSINRRWNVKKETKNICWAVTIAVLTFLTFFCMKYGREDGLAIALLFPSLGRLVWGLSISFIILATSTQFGKGSISRFYSAKFFIPFSRLSFCAYVLNPLVIMMIFQKCQTSYHGEFYMLPVENFGFLCLVNLIALIFMLVVMQPVGHLINMML